MNSPAPIELPAAEPAPDVTGRPLRFLTCGSVDDGKSTLIGRLLWDTKAVKQDHAESLQNGPAPAQNNLGLPDFALLLDGLQAEREQGITIDVAYRYFSSGRRSFIVADTPGHEQYTRNMATGASTADVAVILVDARHGLLEQTRRHTAIAALLGIRHLVLAVNKIDLTGYDRSGFENISSAFKDLARSHGIDDIVAIPVSALRGENVVNRADATMPWYGGQTLIEALDAAPAMTGVHGAFRFPVQRVVRPHEGLRGYQGTLAGGSVSPGDEIAVLPGGQTARVARIITFDGSPACADAGDAVTLTLDRPVDIARGDMLAAPARPPLRGQSFQARLIVLNDDGLDPGKSFWLKSTGRRQSVQVKPEAVLDLASGDWRPASRLTVNQIADAELRFGETAIFDRYVDNRVTGAFILVDPESNETVAGGMISACRSTAASMTPDGPGERVVISLPARLADRLIAHEAFSGFHEHARISRLPESGGAVSERDTDLPA